MEEKIAETQYKTLDLNGSKINSIASLVTALEQMDDKTFSKVHESISVWLTKSVSDKRLLQQLSKLKYRKNILKTLQDRVEIYTAKENGLFHPENHIDQRFYAYKVKLVQDFETCVPCDLCSTVCPKEAVSMETSQPTILQDKCVLCGVCIPFCPVGAIEITINDAPSNPAYTSATIPKMPELEPVNEVLIRRLFDGTLIVDESKCPIDCEECVRYCPTGAIERDGKHVPVDDDLCVLCGSCKQACPYDAIQVNRTIINHEEGTYSAVWAQIIEDLIGAEKLNMILNNFAMTKIITAVNEPSMETYLKPVKPKLD